MLLQHMAETSTAFASSTDPVSQGIVATIIVAVFLLLATDKVHRLLVVIGAVALIWAVTYLSPFKLISFEAAGRALDLNVLFLLAAMMAVVGVLKQTGIFEYWVARLVNRAGGDPVRVLVLMLWFTAALSACCDNVTTVIFVAPMALQVSRIIRLNPIALLLPIVMASNIGGTATLIGDPPNIMIGSGAGLSFVDFLANITAPIVVMLVFLTWYSVRYYRRDLLQSSEYRGPEQMEVPGIIDPVLLRWAAWIGAFIFIGFVTHGLTGMPASVPATIGAGFLLVVQDVLYLRKNKPTPEERRHGLLNIIEREIEWPTLSFFGFLFIAVGAAVSTGLIDTLANGLGRSIQSGSAALGLGPSATLLFAAVIIAWVSGFLSAIIDNIPFVAVMIPIIHRLRPDFAGDTTVLWWALALGACLGGNGSPIGASANVTVLGVAERQGHRLTFREFTRFGSRVTAATLIISTVFLWTHVYFGARNSLLIWGVAAIVLLGFRMIVSPAKQ